MRTELKEAEKEVIIKFLVKNKFNLTNTAKELEVDRKTVYNKIHSLGIDLNKLKLESFNAKLMAE